MILPEWAAAKDSSLPRVLEGQFSDKQIHAKNLKGYNIYHFPNGPEEYTPGTNVTGSHITTFKWCFVDCDLKDGVYADKEDFLDKVTSINIPPTRVIDSGNGIHVYWKVTNLDAMSYLRFQRRLTRLLKTDSAVGTILQLMRLENTLNTKKENTYIECTLLGEVDNEYTAEEFDKLLPSISIEDETYCKQHYDRTYNTLTTLTVSDKLPAKFGKLLRDTPEAKDLWVGVTDDRSMNDWRLAHLMFANTFTKDEAASVLVSSAKALQRNPHHRVTYAQNIIDKIWTYELTEDKETLELSLSVKDLISRTDINTEKGAPFRCHPRIDNTALGFRLGQVIGLVAGAGVGKTAFALNMFKWFIQRNPEYDHFFIPLEQPAQEIAERWQTMCQNDTSLHEKVQIMSNYDENNHYRHLSLHEIKEYIQKYTRITGKKVGCVVIDHIGVLKRKDKNGKTIELEELCHHMKSFAVETNTLLVMQSQTSREKAGIGDLELNKDAAYGTIFFEAFVDYLITLWQPLKRMHSEPACPTVTAFKFCKIRHKKAKRDIIQEDVPYYVHFDSETEQMKDMTQDLIQSFKYYLPKATNKRKEDRKTQLLSYQSVAYIPEVPHDEA